MTKNFIFGKEIKDISGCVKRAFLFSKIVSELVHMALFKIYY